MCNFVAGGKHRSNSCVPEEIPSEMFNRELDQVPHFSFKPIWEEEVAFY